MYSDADHSGNPDNGCSTSAYMLKMGTGATSWSSQLQSIVALSTTEAEFVATVSASQETIWMLQCDGWEEVDVEEDQKLIQRPVKQLEHTAV
jgi:hypothetical protein